MCCDATHVVRRGCSRSYLACCTCISAWQKCPIEPLGKESGWLLWRATELRTPFFFRPLNGHIFWNRAGKKWYTFLCTNGRFRYIYTVCVSISPFASIVYIYIHTCILILCSYTYVHTTYPRIGWWNIYRTPKRRSVKPWFPIDFPLYKPIHWKWKHVISTSYLHVSGELFPAQELPLPGPSSPHGADVVTPQGDSTEAAEGGRVYLPLGIYNPQEW